MNIQIHGTFSLLLAKSIFEASTFNLLMQAGKTLSVRKWRAAFISEGYLDISKTLSRIHRGVSAFYLETMKVSLHQSITIILSWYIRLIVKSFVTQLALPDVPNKEVQGSKPLPFFCSDSSKWSLKFFWSPI